jgi:hypothetical protein
MRGTALGLEVKSIISIKLTSNPTRKPSGVDALEASGIFRLTANIE